MLKTRLSIVFAIALLIIAAGLKNRASASVAQTGGAANPGPNRYICKAEYTTPQTMHGGYEVYRTDLFEAAASIRPVTFAWQKYLTHTYPDRFNIQVDRAKWGLASAVCMSFAPGQAPFGIEPPAPVKAKIIHVEWKYTPDQQTPTLSTSQQPTASTSPATPSRPGGSAATPESAPNAVGSHFPAATPSGVAGYRVKGYMSCSSLQGAGVNTYFTNVFPVEVNTGRAFRGSILPDSQRMITDAFYEYLTKKGYRFNPNRAFTCDFWPDEAGARAAKHKRAYEGNPCSNCGKVVETGWRYGSTPAPAEESSQAESNTEVASAARPTKQPGTDDDDDVAPSPRPRPRNSLPNTLFVACLADHDPGTAYFSAPFAGRSGDYFAWVQSFTTFLKSNHGFNGVVRCNRYNSVEQAQKFLDERRSALRPARKIVDTRWTFEQ